MKPVSNIFQLVRFFIDRFGQSKGRLLDPFAGSGSTLAAAESVGYSSIGVEMDRAYLDVAKKAIPALAEFAATAETNGHAKRSRLRVVPVEPVGA